MSHNDQMNDSACCCESHFTAESHSTLMKDPWECYEGDTGACAADAVDETDDCACCCCC